MRRFRWTALALAAVAAIVLAAPAAAQDVELKPAKVKRDKNVLTAEEIAERPDITWAYDAIKLLRPAFLRTVRRGSGAGSGGAYSGGTSDPYKPGGGGMEPAGSNSTGPVFAMLHIDEMPQPDLERLKQMPVSEVLEIRYLSKSEAVRYGDGHEAGAILLKTKKFAKP